MVVDVATLVLHHGDPAPAGHGAGGERDLGPGVGGALGAAGAISSTLATFIKPRSCSQLQITTYFLQFIHLVRSPLSPLYSLLTSHSPSRQTLRPVWPHLVPSWTLLLNLRTTSGWARARQSRLQGDSSSSDPTQSWPSSSSSPCWLLKAAHCWSLSESADSGQGERTQERQAWEEPSQPLLSRHTRRLVWRPSEPQLWEQRDHGDHGDQEESGRTVWMLVEAGEAEGRPRERARPSI